MRRVNLPSVGNIKDPAAKDAIREIELASAEADIIDMAQAFSVNGAFTETRVLNVTAPTAANIASFLATLLADFQRGGAKRNT